MCRQKTLSGTKDYFYLDNPELEEAHALDAEIALKLGKCSKGQKLIISKLIDAILDIPREDLSL